MKKFKTETLKLCQEKLKELNWSKTRITISDNFNVFLANTKTGLCK